MAEAGEVLLAAEGISKKFCRSLKRSLLYGAIDIAAAFNPWHRHSSDREATTSLPLRRDEFWAVRDVSFEVRRGECLGLIGHNGAGKSTILKLLNGLIAPDRGRIVTRGRVAALIELNAGFNPILTGRENIVNQAALLGLSPAEIEQSFDQIVEFSEVEEFIDMPVQNYSSGMKVRLGFAVAVHMKPDVLIIDEVLAVGDAAFRYKSLNAIGELMRSSAVVFVSHAMPQIFRVCNEVMVLDHGSVSFYGADVAAGVSEYLSLFKESQPTVTGSGSVRVVKAQASSGSSVATDGGTVKVGYGQPVSISAQIANNGNVKRARIQFLFWNAELLPVLEIMSSGLSGHEIEFEGEVIEVSASIPSTHLNAGKYSVTVLVVSIDYAEVMCRHDNAVYVQVDAATPSGAHVVEEGSWESAGIG